MSDRNSTQQKIDDEKSKSDPRIQNNHETTIAGKEKEKKNISIKTESNRLATSIGKMHKDSTFIMYGAHSSHPPD